MIAGALDGLDGEEWELVMGFVQQFADMLKAKHPTKNKRCNIAIRIRIDDGCTHPVPSRSV